MEQSVESVAGKEAARSAAVRRRRVRVGALLLGALLLVGAGGGGFLWWQHLRDRLPDGFAVGNGRIEADDIDITPKYAGRVAELLVDEGDLVQAGQVVARMDTRETEAMLDKARAGVGQAGRALAEAHADVAARRSQLTLAQRQIERTRRLLREGVVTRELMDEREQQLDGASAALAAAEARVGEAQHAVDAARQDVAYDELVIADGVLVAPRTARVQYRLVNTGEVVGAGAKIFTLLDLSNVYMTVFLPTREAGKVALGAEGRIVLDALPKLIVPGHVSFVSPTSQFTPKMVETQSERDKLVFRVKVRVDPDVLKRHLAQVRTGLPGIAYVRLDPKLAWPARLEANVPP